MLKILKISEAKYFKNWPKKKKIVNVVRILLLSCFRQHRRVQEDFPDISVL